jgi:hypothetical protein
MDSFWNHEALVRAMGDATVLRKIIAFLQHLSQQNGTVSGEMAIVKLQWNSAACIFNARPATA